MAEFFFSDVQGSTFTGALKTHVILYQTTFKPNQGNSWEYWKD